MYSTLLSNIIDQIPVPILVTDPHGKGIWTSEVFRQSWMANGFTQPVEGFDMSTLRVFLMDGAPLPREQWPLSRSVQTLEIVKNEQMKVLVNDDWVYINVSSSPVLDTEGKCAYVYLIIEDISDKIEREQEQHLIKVQAEFLARMSHELRTPMHGILGMLDVMTPCDQQQAHHIGVLQRSANHLLKTLNDILDYSKLEAGCVQLDPHLFNVRHLLEDIQYMFSSTTLNTSAPPCIDLIVSDAVPAEMFGDSHRIGQCLNNLVLNAVKFVDPKVERAMVSLEADMCGGSLVFAVKDRGIGMSPETMKKVFSPFMQAHSGITRIYGGTGLGLPISKKLANALGGDITVESELGKGSTFSLSLPFTGPSRYGFPNQPRYELIYEKLKNNGDLRILLAEDNPINKIVTTSLLKKHGFKVDTVENGLETLEAIDTNPDYDLLLLDIQMPKLGGHDTCRILRARQWNKPIIALTASAMERDKVLCLEAGMTDYMSKPFKVEELIEKIHKLAKPDFR